MGIEIKRYLPLLHLPLRLESEGEEIEQGFPLQRRREDSFISSPFPLGRGRIKEGDGKIL